MPPAIYLNLATNHPRSRAHAQLLQRTTISGAEPTPGTAPAGKRTTKAVEAYGIAAQRGAKYLLDATQAPSDRTPVEVTKAIPQLLAKNIFMFQQLSISIILLVLVLGYDFYGTVAVMSNQ